MYVVARFFFFLLAKFSIVWDLLKRVSVDTQLLMTWVNQAGCSIRLIIIISNIAPDVSIHFVTFFRFLLCCKFLWKGLQFDSLCYFFMYHHSLRLIFEGLYFAALIAPSGPSNVPCSLWQDFVKRRARTNERLIRLWTWIRTRLIWPVGELEGCTEK